VHLNTGTDFDFLPLKMHHPRPAHAGVENAIKHVYNPLQKTWSAAPVSVSLAPQAFQEGTMRHVFELTDFSLAPGQQRCVAKLSKDPREPRRTYFAEVEMQFKCKEFAQQYNAKNPPKHIDFVDTWVIEFTHRPSAAGGSLVALVEPMLKGHYTKHSNNFGFVSPDDRNTPHAFSHWTWVASGGKMLVCDIQGVGDNYTDPQIHSNAGHHNFLFGRGDMGIEGVQQFFATHRCNGLCRYLGLPPTPGTPMPSAFERGTQVRSRPTSPAPDFFGRPTSYSSVSSPASSVGALSSASGGFTDLYSGPRVVSMVVSQPMFPAMVSF